MTVLKIKIPEDSFFVWDKIRIDNYPFRLHSYVTTLLLWFFTGFVTASVLFGDPIKCINVPDIGINYVNAHCWMASTYIVKSKIIAPRQPLSKL